jgi:HK97 family phage major capsid protein
MLSEVFQLEQNYGVAARLCRTVNVTSDSVKAAALSATVSFTEVTTETGTKATTKPTFTYPTVELREFAGIVVMTDQLLEDAAFDVRGFVAEELARAAAKKEDELLLTDATTGLTKIAGTVVVRIGAALANLDFDDVIDAQYGVPTASQEGGSWILARAAVPVLRKIKSTDGSYIWGASPNAETPASINGAPYYISEVMNDAATGLDKAYAVFGNFGRYAVLIRKAGLKLTFHDSGTVNVGGTDYNLIQQDMTAMRAVIRRNVFIPLPGAFAVLKSNAS